MNLIIAIAALCQTSSKYLDVAVEYQLKCQKYYIQCFREDQKKENNNLRPADWVLADCVEKRKL